MREFRTIVKPEQPCFSISHSDILVSIGSCFSENIGKKFNDYKFRININPFGQQYNPYSISASLNRLLYPVEYKKEDLIYHNEQYHSYDHHGSFSQSTGEETLRVINTGLSEASVAIKNCSVLFLTFGTSHIFQLKSDNRIVSNCHKLPGTLFNRFMLTPEKIITCTENALLELWKINKEVKIVLTVSPVRYFAFGEYENSVSKAHLFTAIYALQQKYPQLYYFPAYELVMDDLRDYRYYSDDMLHPSDMATNYVWEVLSETMVSKPALEVVKEIEEILQAVHHRPRNPKSESHQKFIKKYLDKIQLMETKYSIDMKSEKETLVTQFLQ
jgi:hypothetical protein